MCLPVQEMQETWVQSLGWEHPLEKGKATHTSILAWRIIYIVHGVAKSWARLADFHFTSTFPCSPTAPHRLSTKVSTQESSFVGISFITYCLLSFYCNLVISLVIIWNNNCHWTPLSFLLASNTPHYNSCAESGCCVVSTADGTAQWGSEEGAAGGVHIGRAPEDSGRSAAWFSDQSACVGSQLLFLPAWWHLNTVLKFVFRGQPFKIIRNYH